MIALRAATVDLKVICQWRTVDLRADQANNQKIFTQFAGNIARFDCPRFSRALLREFLIAISAFPAFRDHSFYLEARRRVAVLVGICGSTSYRSIFKT